jgi:eukaryotic-like serine/threonine-protein kinase
VKVDFEVVTTLHDEECYVPGGPALLGGDKDSPYGEDMREVDIPPFIIQRYPVRFSEYLAFLADVRSHDPARADAFVPTSSYGAPYWRWDGGQFVPTKRWNTRFDLLEIPAFGVDMRSALAYAAWKSERSGLKYRLPTEPEWEKAARGTDGRKYPWGDYFDASFCKMRESRPGQLEPEPPGSFEADTSPYGVRDLAGCVAEWVTPIEHGKASYSRAQVVSRGGAWCDSHIDCTLIGNRPYRTSQSSARVGFRLVRQG